MHCLCPAAAPMLITAAQFMCQHLMARGVLAVRRAISAPPPSEKMTWAVWWKKGLARHPSILQLLATSIRSVSYCITPSAATKRCGLNSDMGAHAHVSITLSRVTG